MADAENKHVTIFRNSKLKAGETILCSLEGYIGEMMGKGDKKQHNGALVVTNQRVCFYRKGILGEVLETIPLSKLTSIETRSMLGCRVLRMHTSHDDLEFKTFAPVDRFDFVHEKIDELREGAPRAINTGHAAAAPAEDIPAQIRKLAELKDSGILTEDEFTSKKADLLARL